MSAFSSNLPHSPFLPCSIEKQVSAPLKQPLDINRLNPEKQESQHTIQAKVESLKVLEASGKSTESNVETLLTQEIYQAMPKGFDEILEEENLVN